MSNSFFQFKQFRIHQERNAMKVCTDSCLFGAWIPTQHGRVLDIGTGTGLLSLMIAQRMNGSDADNENDTSTELSNGLVDAVELQPEAAAEATENILASPWHDRIFIHQGNVLDTSLSIYKNRYDTIVCNPPFYSSHLQGEDTNDVTARHDIALPLDRLTETITLLLKHNGSAFLLLPYEPFKDIHNITRNSGLKLKRIAAVKNFASKLPIRWMLELVHEHDSEIKKEEIIIYNDDRTYTEAFTELLRPYYLYL